MFRAVGKHQQFVGSVKVHEVFWKAAFLYEFLPSLEYKNPLIPILIFSMMVSLNKTITNNK